MKKITQITTTVMVNCTTFTNENHNTNVKKPTTLPIQLLPLQRCLPFSKLQVVWNDWFQRHLELVRQRRALYMSQENTVQFSQSNTG